MVFGVSGQALRDGRFTSCLHLTPFQVNPLIKGQVIADRVVNGLPDFLYNNFFSRKTKSGTTFILLLRRICIASFPVISHRLVISPMSIFSLPLVSLCFYLRVLIS